jgi:galactonate dehydratase
VAPPPPNSPVSTAANVQICSVLRNFRLLEFQWGEIGWRADVLTPAEQFDRGTLHVPSRPGFGIALNEPVARAHQL